MRYRLTECGRRIRSGTHYRLAATMLDEMLAQTKVCGRCCGRAEDCDACLGVRMEPATVGWRSDRSGIRHADFRATLEFVYQRIYAELHRIERSSKDDTPAGSCAH